MIERALEGITLQQTKHIVVGWELTALAGHPPECATAEQARLWLEHARSLGLSPDAPQVALVRERWWPYQPGEGWVRYPNKTAWQVARTLARGGYQVDLLDGRQAWSGSTLKGKAASYGGKYARSRTALEKRLRQAGLTVTYEMVGKRKVAVIG